MVSVLLQALTIATVIVFVGPFGTAHAGADQSPATQQTETERLSSSEAEDEGGIDPNILVGHQLYDANGDEIGEITAVLLAQGEITAVVVSIGDNLGLGKRAVVVPVEALDVDVAMNRLVTPELSGHQIGKLPEYEP